MQDDLVAAIHQFGHRAFVGGDGPFWDVISALQFDFLCGQGLLPSDSFLDIACGSLRGGRRFIQYLEPGKYHGIDRYIELIIYGVTLELGIDLYREKAPRFVVSETFEFARFDADFRFGIAQSLFTHLNRADIALCLDKLSAAVRPGCRIFCTFFESAGPAENPRSSHALALFQYTRAEMEDLGEAAGWRPRYIGDWKHPRGQRMIEFVKPAS